MNAGDERFHIVLDSTVFGRVPLAQYPVLRQLAGFARITDSTIYVPDIVIQETTARLPAAVRVSFQAVRRGLSDLAGIPGISGISNELDIEEVISNAARLFEENLVELGFVVHTPAVGHREVVQRLLMKRRPFGQTKGGDEEGYGDYLVWRTAIEVALANPDGRVVLISDDKAAFGDDSREPKLAPDLESEIKDLSVAFEWHTHPGAFLKSVRQVQSSARVRKAVRQFVDSGQAEEAITERMANAYLAMYGLDLGEAGIPDYLDDLEIVGVSDMGPISVESTLSFDEWESVSRLRAADAQLVVQQVIDADDLPPLDDSDIAIELSQLSRRYTLARMVLPAKSIDLEIAFELDDDGRVLVHYVVVDDIQL